MTPPKQACLRCHAPVYEPFMSGTYWLQWCTKCGTLIERSRKHHSHGWIIQEHTPTDARGQR